MNYNFIDKTNMKFGKITVLARGEDHIFPNGSKQVTWICECECGNTITVISGNLSKTHSCGKCNRTGKKLQDLSGRKYGKLTVLSRSKNIGKQTAWLCQCDCGSTVIVQGNHLKDGTTKSCGCTKSFYEEEISNILHDKKIAFEREYSFKDCIRSNGHVVYFDFAIFENHKLKALIEFQGEQHFRKDIFFGKLQRDETDMLKKEYCKTHNIPLFEILYNENIKESLCNILSNIA